MRDALIKADLSCLLVLCLNIHSRTIIIFVSNQRVTFTLTLSSYLPSNQSNLVDFSAIMSYARNIEKRACTLALCQGQRACRAKNRKSSK